MHAVTDLPGDDSPPQSGIRLRTTAFPVEPCSAVSELAPVPSTEPRILAEAVALVGEEVVLETWSLVRALSPLQGAWLRLGILELGAAVLTAGSWHRRGYGGRARLAGRAPIVDRESRHTTNLLRERWPELVPGYSAMDCLAGLMVDTIC